MRFGCTSAGIWMGVAPSAGALSGLRWLPGPRVPSYLTGKRARLGLNRHGATGLVELVVQPKCAEGVDVTERVNVEERRYVPWVLQRVPTMGAIRKEITKACKRHARTIQ